jgi:hypothetical protein
MDEIVPRLQRDKLRAHYRGEQISIPKAAEILGINKESAYRLGRQGQLEARLSLA